jgi:hypothetical protein
MSKDSRAQNRAARARGSDQAYNAQTRAMFPASDSDSETVTVTRAQLRRVLRDMGLTVTGTGAGDQVFDALRESRQS